MARHDVRIHVADRKGCDRNLLTNRVTRIRERLARALFGDFCQVLVMSPGKTIRTIEIVDADPSGSSIRVTDPMLQPPATDKRQRSQSGMRRSQGGSHEAK